MDRETATLPSSSGADIATAEQAEANQLLEQLQAQLLHAQAAPEPGTLKVGDNVGEGRGVMIDTETGNQVPIAQVAASVTSAGYVWMYDRFTGERSRSNANPSTLKQNRRKLNKDGETMFTFIKPKVAPPVYEHKCLLHPDNPQRAHFTAMGLAVCKKSNLRSQYEVERHTKRRHPSEWATIELERERKEKDEERAWRAAVLQNAGLSPALLVASQPSQPKKAGRPRKGAA